MLCMQAEELPDDLMPAVEAAREFNIEYDTLKSWWKRGKLRRWRRGSSTRPTFVRRSDVQRLATIAPVDAPP